MTQTTHTGDTKMDFLPKNIREEMEDWVFGAWRDALVENVDDYVKTGLTFKGVRYMSDKELLDEYSDLIMDEEDELLLKALTEYEAHSLIQEA